MDIMLERLNSVNKTVIVSTEELIKKAIDRKATDIHILGENVSFRINGVLEYQNLMIRAEDVFNQTATEQNKYTEKENLFCVYAFSMHNRRFRATYARAYDGIRTATIRLLSDVAPPIDSTVLGNYPAFLSSIKTEKAGITLVTGAVASGKSTTCASLISHIARYKPKTVTIEDPIEFLFEPLSSENQVVQREVGEHIKTYESGIVSILTENPDMIFVGETRNKEVALQVLQAAMSGSTVISTFHATGPKEAKARFRAMVPDEFKEDVEMYLKNIIWQDMYYENGERKFLHRAMVNNEYLF